MNNHKFKEGDLVHHKRYDYRGVIVGFDPVCMADDAWYQKNMTQPSRDQAWYHVLVDGAGHTTYVAEENLEADQVKQPVTHPLLKQFFTSFHEGRYYKESLN